MKSRQILLGVKTYNQLHILMTWVRKKAGTVGILQHKLSQATNVCRIFTDCIEKNEGINL